MSLKKARKIIGSHLQDLPVGEKWYQDRLAICETCPLNTKNTEEKGPTVSAMLANVGLMSSQYCVACGCPIKNKASVKSEICGAVKRGMEAKWFPLEVDSHILKGAYLINTEPENYTIEDGADCVVLRPTPSSKEMWEFNTELFVPKGQVLQSAQVSCSCVVAQAVRVSETNFKISIKVSTIAFTKGEEDTKRIYLKFAEKSLLRTLTIKLKMVKL